MPAPTLAYVSAGRLFVKRDEEPALELSSPFAEDVRARGLRLERRHAWKEEGRGARFAGQMLWGGVGSSHDTQRPARFVALGRGADSGSLIYALDTGAVSGVFSADAMADAPSTTERRLFHTGDFHVRHLGRSADHEWLCCEVAGDEGLSHLGVMREDGSDFEALTEGDAIDAAPCWADGVHAQILYQTAGMGRDEEGHALGQSPFSIARIDVPSAEITGVLEEAGYDLLSPRASADALYCIRRPYHDPWASDVSAPRKLGTLLLDVLLFVPRLLFAIFQMASFFTARYTGKPLTTAGGPQRRGADATQMMIWGNLIDLERSAREGALEQDGTRSVVPKSYELCRYALRDGRAVGAPTVLATGVVAYDLAPDGDLLYSNGRAIYRLADGDKQKLVSAEAITRVIVVSCAGDVGSPMRSRRV